MKAHVDQSFKNRLMTFFIDHKDVISARDLKTFLTGILSTHLNVSTPLGQLFKSNMSLKMVNELENLQLREEILEPPGENHRSL